MNDNEKQKQTIILAAGGTGGHIFPAEALAEELIAHGKHVVLVTDSRFKGYGGVLGDIEIFTIRAGRMVNGILGKLAAVGNIAIGILQARSILRRLKPQAVVGFGGYPSFPTMYAATAMGLPTVIHEQNAVLGRANRMLAARVNRIATSFVDTGLVAESEQHKLVLTGNPVRSGIRALHAVPYPELSQDGVIRLLVMGGSQGASVFSEILPAAMATLPRLLRSRIRIDQQCRKEDIEVTRAAYDEIEMPVDLSEFFTDVPARMAAAHLVISRSGASTIAELMAAGRPAILIPYPNSADDHQYHNARAVEEAGGGWLMPEEGFTASALAARIESFLNLPTSLMKAAKQMKQSGYENAGEQLANVVLTVSQSSDSEVEEGEGKEGKRAKEKVA